jgi:hypothetical protein
VLVITFTSRKIAQYTQDTYLTAQAIVLAAARA